MEGQRRQPLRILAALYFCHQFIPGPFNYQNIPSDSGFSLPKRSISAPSQSTLHGDSEARNKHRPQLSIVKQTISEL